MSYYLFIFQTLGFVERDLSLPLYVPGEAYSYELLKKLNDKDYEVNIYFALKVFFL